jgi:hypothetical protein
VRRNETGNVDATVYCRTWRDRCLPCRSNGLRLNGNPRCRRRRQPVRSLRPRQAVPSNCWGHRGGAGAGTVSAGDCPFKPFVGPLSQAIGRTIEVEREPEWFRCRVNYGISQGTSSHSPVPSCRSMVN